MRKVLKNNRGMTLVEIMIVLAIIGGLMAMLAPRFMGQQQKSRVQNARMQLSQLMGSTSMYFTDCGRLPETAADLVQASESCPNWGPEPYYDGLIEDGRIVDPWGNDVIYEKEGSQYNFITLGADGREGGTAYDTDIRSDEL